MKIRVLDSDGEFRGGVLNLHKYRLHHRSWPGFPHPHYQEAMLDYTSLDEPSHEGSWFLLRMSKNPEMSGSASDSFDHASHALRLRPPEAVHWFENNACETPPDLLELARKYKEQRDETDNDDNRTAELHEPLTSQQQKIWELLDGRAMPGKEIAMSVYGKPTHTSAVRKQIETIRKTGRRIDNKRSCGYYRPDAPPPDFK